MKSNRWSFQSAIPNGKFSNNDERLRHPGQRPRIGGPACTEDKFVVLVRARARPRVRGGCGGRGAGARRLLRSEHLRPRSVAPLAACSSPRAAHRLHRVATPPTVCQTPLARRGRPAARPPLRRAACWRSRLCRPAGFVISPGGP